MGALLPWRPFREFEGLMRGWEPRFPRFFEEFEEGAEEIAPPIESYVKDGAIVVCADVPGLDPKDIEISVLHDTLTIKGERKREQEVKKEDYLRREVSYGTFERRLSLPHGVLADKVKASFKNGVAVITIPLAEEVQPRKIPLEIEQEKKIEVEKK